MKTTVKIFAIIGIVIGGIGAIGLLNETGDDVLAGLMICGLLLAWGIIDLCFLKSLNK